MAVSPVSSPEAAEEPPSRRRDEDHDKEGETQMSLHHSRTSTLLVALALLSSLAPAAHAKQGMEEATNDYRATTKVSRPMPAPPAVPKSVTNPQSSTFPEGSSDYHGANGG